MPASEDFFSDEKGEPFPKENLDEFHNILYKGLFARKCTIPGIYPIISTEDFKN